MQQRTVLWSQCWEGLPQRESDIYAFSGRVVKYLEKEGDSITVFNVDGGLGGKAILRIRYSRQEKEETQYGLYINDMYQKPLLFAGTGSHSMKSSEYFDTEVELEKGRSNRISLRKEGRKESDRNFC